MPTESERSIRISKQWVEDMSYLQVVEEYLGAVCGPAKETGNKQFGSTWWDLFSLLGCISAFSDENEMPWDKI